MKHLAIVSTSKIPTYNCIHLLIFLFENTRISKPCSSVTLGRIPFIFQNMNYSAIYPHLSDFTGKLNFVIKVDPLNLESQNQARKIPVALPSFPI